jgi:hypothetical protein
VIGVKVYQWQSLTMAGTANLLNLCWMDEPKKFYHRHTGLPWPILFIKSLIDTRALDLNQKRPCSSLRRPIPLNEK